MLLVFRRGRRLRWLAVAVPVVALLAFRPVLDRAAALRRDRNEHRLAHAVRGRFAPSAGAETLLELGSGAVVRVAERWGDWRRVEHEGSSVWIPAEALPGDAAGMRR